MNLSALAIRFQPIVLTLVGLLMAWGIISFATMPRREDPEFTIRECVVTTVWPGVPAEKIEELVTDKLEEVLDGIEEVEKLDSTTITGQSTINVTVEDAVPPDSIDNVWDKVRARVELVEMPEPSLRPVVNDEFGDTTIFLLAIHQTPTHGRDEIREQDRYSFRQLEVFADRVRDALRLLPGVAKVEKYGVRNEAIFIETDLGTWAQLGLSADQLQQLVAARNIVEAGGDIDTSAGRFSVYPRGEFNAVDEIESIIVDRTTSETDRNQVYLKDLDLNVTRGYEDPPQYLCRYGNPETSEPSVMLGLTMKSGANIITVCDLAKARLTQLLEVEQALPPDVAVVPVSDQSENVTAKINDVVNNVISAVVIVVLVVLVVVGMRSALVMAANIPVVVLASLGVITVFGVQLEQISLASIIIALGLLVDNAVQVCDQARTNQMNGMKPVEAAVEGAKMLAGPMLIGTLTTVAAFIPMLFALEGGGKEYVYSLPVTLSTTLGASWLLAMTFCVLLAASFIRATAESASSPMEKAANFLADRFLPASMKERQNGNGSENIVMRLYGAFAHMAIGAKWITLGVAVVLFVLAVMLPVSSEFFPQDRRDQFAIEIWLPETATIEQTNEKALEVEKIIRALSPATSAEGEPIEKLRAMRTLVGGGGSRWHLGWSPEPPAPNFAEILVRTTDGRLTPDYAEEVRRVVEFGDDSIGAAPVVGARIVPKELPLGPPADPVTIRIVGNGFANMQKLKSIANRVNEMVRVQPETWNVNDSWGVSGYQLAIDVDPDKANLAGVTNSQIAQSLNSYFSGMQLTTFREGDHLVPVYFRVNRQERQTISGLETAFVEGYDSKIPLSSIADFESRWEPAKIERYNRNRTIEVSARVEPGTSGNDVVNRIMASEKMTQLESELPSGFTIEVGGALEESQDSSVQMLTSFGISFLLIILCLVFQYNGWAKPMIILATLPMALIGAMPGLYLSGNPIGFMPQLGILSLFGIVLNTGIIFIEFADILIEQSANKKSPADGPIVGLTRAEFRECLVNAGKQRMLPIFLTTATTVGGLLPLALSGGPLWEGLAWCMIFGLLVATLLTLVVVPALYAIFVETFGVKPIELSRPESA
ncbi:MAG: efflux RND transporter permease subunit [Planctomycetota bacterium]